MTPFMTEDFLLDTEFSAVCTMTMPKTSRFSTITATCLRSRLPKIIVLKICMTSG